MSVFVLSKPKYVYLLNAHFSVVKMDPKMLSHATLICCMVIFHVCLQARTAKLCETRFGKGTVL